MAILPEPQRRGEIKFKVAKALPYDVRLALIAILLIGGVVLQLVFASAWAGVPCLAIGSLLSLVQGYDNKLRSAPRDKKWVRVTRQQFDRVIELSEKTKSWDQTFIDITCVRGFLALLVIAGVSFYIYYVLTEMGMELYAQVWVVDATILVLPHWVVGVRSILKNAPLVVKIQNLLGIADLFPQVSKEGEELQYMLEIGETKEGPTPDDAKMVLSFHNASPEFLGLQLQLAINNVQGSDYPYFYCVLVARHAFGLLQKCEESRSATMTVEGEREGDVDVVVMRQTTTKTSGYHTAPSAVRDIFLYSLAETRRALTR
jgi:hypothetical protein